MKQNIKDKIGFFKKFPPQFWLVVIFEFFERGSYYGMMSFISVYFTDTLNIPKESVGIIKGVIQPLLYFLPIISGAVADRFGYRKILMAAFAILGGGYFLTSQMTTYTSVFIALVIMGFGAGMFKPIISGTIARVTDKKNSTQAFGIFYWSINLGAFLFPLFLVPFLKSLNPSYVIIASAVCTGFLIIPTALFFKDPIKKEKVEKRNETSLIQTLANAFEIIYSPLVLLNFKIKKSPLFRNILILILLILMFFSVSHYIKPGQHEMKISSIGYLVDGKILLFNVNRNMSVRENFKISSTDSGSNKNFSITIFKPDRIDLYEKELLEKSLNIGINLSGFDIKKAIIRSLDKIKLTFTVNNKLNNKFIINKTNNDKFVVIVNTIDFRPKEIEFLTKSLHKNIEISGIGTKEVKQSIEKLKTRPFFLLFLLSVIILSLIIMKFEAKFSTTFVIMAMVLLWVIPGLGVLGRIICTIVYLSILSLLIIKKDDVGKFNDHAKFLLMILLYSGFWILYFQMFDSVLWYVQAYVDAASLNIAVNKFLGLFGIAINWFFDVEHVTVINAGVIILLQLLISNIVKNRNALPTMMTGIGIATIGMGILAISTNIWIFITGIILFSVGEMTAHPKFISYIGITAPPDKKAMYMGYLFLYGVFGSSIGGVLGAKLYVHFVDNLNQPRTLWLVFSGIGIITIIGLLLYNKFFVKNIK